MATKQEVLARLGQSYIARFNHCSLAVNIQDDGTEPTDAELQAFVTAYKNYGSMSLYESQTIVMIEEYLNTSTKYTSPTITCVDNIVTITCEGADTIMYATGSSTEYAAYTSTITITEDNTFHAYSTKSGYANSDTVNYDAVFTNAE